MTEKLIELPRSQMTFKNKTHLKFFLGNLLENIQNKDINSTHDYYNFFADMIDRHYFLTYEVDMKFVVHTNDGYNLKRSREKTPYRRSEKFRAYVFLPSSGKWRSFSLLNKCVNGRDDSERIKKNKLYRKIIEPQIQLERKKRKLECENCESKYLLDMDHYPKTFYEIVQSFESMFEPLDPKEFYKYHLENATYRLLCKNCHNRIGFRPNFRE